MCWATRAERHLAPPIEPQRVALRFQLPAGWRIAGSIFDNGPASEGSLQVREVIMFQISSLLKNSILTATVCFAATSAMAQSTGKPTDPQIADIAYTAGQIDVTAANLERSDYDGRAFWA